MVGVEFYRVLTCFDRVSTCVGCKGTLRTEMRIRGGCMAIGSGPRCADALMIARHKERYESGHNIEKRVKNGSIDDNYSTTSTFPDL